LIKVRATELDVGAGDILERVSMKLLYTRPSPAGLTRGSIFLHMKMDCRVKPGQARQ
jgi:hypothetical protein